jgi:hypothetical protein
LTKQLPALREGRDLTHVEGRIAIANRVINRIEGSRLLEHFMEYPDSAKRCYVVSPMTRISDSVATEMPRCI